MEGYKVSFNIYANSQEEADAVSQMLGAFVDDYARKGLAVSAERLISLPRVWETNSFIKSRIQNYLRYGK